MRNLLHLFLLTFILSCLVNNLKAQSLCNCDAPKEDTKKIFFNGKAPLLWAIDGQILDWQDKILGQPTEENATKPFELPESSAFNWTIEEDIKDNNTSDSNEDCSRSITETPLPDQDINLLAYTHDDYNVFFYFRRLANGNSPNSFYYFFDVDADGHMKKGEPVFHATFTDTQISSLTLSRYIPDITHLYAVGKGNPLGVGDPRVRVQGYAMPGKLEKVFSSSNIPFKKRLRKNELFDAALTEDGYGVELAIPWRFLRLWLVDKRKEQILNFLDQLKEQSSNRWRNSWLDKWINKLMQHFGDKWKNTKPSKPGDIFFYRLSMKQGGEQYIADRVVDNVGNFMDGVGKSGNLSFDISFTPAVFIPGKGYRFKVTYTNLTNAPESFRIESIGLFPTNGGEELAFAAKAYLDKTCNGIIDPPGDSALEYELVGFEPINHISRLYSIVAKPFGKACFIIEILPSETENFDSVDVEVYPYISFIPYDICREDDDGRTIKQIGVKSTTIVKSALIQNKIKENEPLEDNNTPNVRVYPNPTKGSTRVYLPTKQGVVNITLEDYLGRKVQQWNNFTSNSLQINNLKRGLYFLRVQYVNSGKVVSKKIVAQ